MVSSDCVPESENKLLIEIYILPHICTTYFRHILCTNSTYVQLVTTINSTYLCMLQVSIVVVVVL